MRFRVKLRDVCEVLETMTKDYVKELSSMHCVSCVRMLLIKYHLNTLKQVSNVVYF